MKKVKLYDSYEFLKKRYVDEKKSIQDICDETGASYNTIRNKLRGYQLFK